MRNLVINDTNLSTELITVTPFSASSGEQMQSKSSILSRHVPPYPHGFEAQSFTFILQSGPVNPGAHSHKNQLTPSMHLPPFWHGWGMQSFTSS
jgi:hypothetical protein